MLWFNTNTFLTAKIYITALEMDYTAHFQYIQTLSGTVLNSDASPFLHISCLTLFCQTLMDKIFNFISTLEDVCHTSSCKHFEIVVMVVIFKYPFYHHLSSITCNRTSDYLWLCQQCGTDGSLEILNRNPVIQNVTQFLV